MESELTMNPILEAVGQGQGGQITKLISLQMDEKGTLSQFSYIYTM